jgi:Chlorovirus DNA primase
MSNDVENKILKRREYKLPEPNNKGAIYSGVKRWIKSKGTKEDPLFLKDEDRIPTHLLLDGGKLCVPDRLSDWFHKCYANDIITKQVNYIAEAKTHIFKMIIDLDFYDDKFKTFEELRPYLKTIQKAVSSFYPNLEDYKKRMIVCTTEHTEGSVKNNKIFVKQGLGHLVWPDILIDNSVGNRIRMGCIQQLIKEFGTRHAENIWEDVVDSTIYKKNGLRMIGSAKMEICKGCIKKRKKGQADFAADCDMCLGVGKYYKGRIYSTTDVFDVNGDTMEDEIEKLQTNIVYMVKQTSIRSPEKFFTEYKIPEWFDSFHYNFEQETKNQRIRKKFYGNDRTGLSEEDSKGMKEHTVKTKVNIDDLIWKAIVDLINEVMPEVYKNIEIMDIKQCEGKKRGGKKGHYFWVRTNCSFCMNIADYHNSNTIYFVVNEMGICQKCFCRCETTLGRKFGVMCKNYHSEIKPFNNTETVKLLFPDSFEAQVDSWDRFQSSSYDMKKEKIMDQLKTNIKCCQDYIMGKAAYEERFSSKKKQK